MYIISLRKLRIRPQYERYSKLDCRSFQYRNLTICEQRWRLWPNISWESEVIFQNMMTAQYNRSSPDFSHYTLIKFHS